MRKGPSPQHFHLFLSNRVEHLGRILSDVLRTPPDNPLDREIILVQSQGMEQWISMVLARHHGICANTWFPFPNAFFNWLFKKLTPQLPDISPFDPEKMTWDILRCLKAFLPTPAFSPLRLYLGGDMDREDWGIKGYQLAGRIAETFDQYLLFRPDMIRAWEKGEETHWQAILWRRLVEGKDALHRAALARSFLRAVDDPSVSWEDLPHRVSVFGISALPPYHMTILNGLSRLMEVNLFVMNPCRVYWGDILPGREVIRRSRDPSARGVATEDLHLEKGNSLLASMGTLGRDFFDLMETLDAQAHEAFQDPVGETAPEPLLSTIQSQILNLEDAERLARKISIDPGDASIQVHSCHSPMREVEVLYDRVLDMLESDADLGPRDILVMAPDINVYAPLIDAVFDPPGDTTPQIPYRIADRGIRNRCDIIETFFEILELPANRFSAPRVLHILESEAVRMRFHLAESDLDLIRKWVEETAIRWGMDETDRAERGFPGLEENTWAAGIKRLLLGYALSNQGIRWGSGETGGMFGHILPYDLMEGGETAVMGGFVQFVDVLFSLTRHLDAPRPPRKWSDTLNRLLDRLFMPTEAAQADVQVLRKAFHDLGEMPDRDGAPFEDLIGADVVRAYLREQLDRAHSGAGFMTGGMTFCSLLPMRSIPFRIVCLLGMNSRDYPRESIRPGFDLIARSPRPGDRSRRNDDRYLFLEALLSARSTLYLSYVGQSIQDNSPSPPSVLVSELMDYIEEGFQIPHKKILAHLVTEHRLQPFHEDYFKNARNLFSYSRDLLDVARGLTSPHRADGPFITGELTPPESEFMAVTVDDLCAFFAHPSRYLLKKRLGIHLDPETVPLSASEPFDLTGLDRYHMAQDLMSSRLEGEDLRLLFERTRAGGRLPHGQVGRYLFQDLCQGLELFSDKTACFMDASMMPPLEIDRNIGDFRLTGRMHGIYPDHLISYRYAAIKGKDRMRIWIHHLLLNVAVDPEYPSKSILVGLGKKNREPVWSACEYRPMEPETALTILEGLLDFYREGLIHPLHFFPESGYEYAQRKIEKGQAPEKALDAARLKWSGTPYTRGEREDPYYQLCFKETDPLDGAFEALTEKVIGPLLRHQRII